MTEWPIVRVCKTRGASLRRFESFPLDSEPDPAKRGRFTVMYRALHWYMTKQRQSIIIIDTLALILYFYSHKRLVHAKARRGFFAIKNKNYR